MKSKLFLRTHCTVLSEKHCTFKIFLKRCVGVLSILICFCWDFFSLVSFSLSFSSGKGNDEEGKRKVSQIHEMKEKLKQENDFLKKLKQNLKDVQEKQKNEKEVNTLILNCFNDISYECELMIYY